MREVWTDQILHHAKENGAFLFEKEDEEVNSEIE
jgi:hypothetical protein